MMKGRPSLFSLSLLFVMFGIMILSQATLYDNDIPGSDLDLVNKSIKED